MTHVQKLLIVIGTAVLFQLGTALAALSAGDLAEPKQWAVGLLVGVANAVGVALVALKTANGIGLGQTEPK